MVKHLTSKIAIGIYLLVAIGFGVWGYMIFKYKNQKLPAMQQEEIQTSNIKNSNETQNQLPTSEPSQTEVPNSNKTINTNAPETMTNIDADKSASTLSKPKTTPSGSKLENISPEQCSSNCHDFKKDSKKLDYCQQVCGITPVEKVDDCNEQKDLQKDYCLKGLAITNEDISQCDNINDANIKQSCKNRITQDIIESQQQTSQGPID